MGRLQQAISYKLASQLDLNPNQATTPSNLFPSYTLPGGSWHTFILGRIWGYLRSLGEIASICLASFVIFGTLWYLIKVLMNCHYLYRSHGFTPILVWAFCTEVLFAYHYKRTTRPGVGLFPRQPGRGPSPGPTCCGCLSLCPKRPQQCSRRKQ